MLRDLVKGMIKEKVRILIISCLNNVSELYTTAADIVLQPGETLLDWVEVGRVWW
jgi:hypothetical protein